VDDCKPLLVGYEDYDQHGFNSALIFSIATQMTIGYGTREIKVVR
jgi:hypothetical protein